MAVVKVPQSNRIQLKVQTGISASGAPVYAYRNLNNVKTSAPDESMYDVATSLATLQSRTLVAISTVATSNLVEE